MAHLFKPTYTKIDPKTGKKSKRTLRKWYARYQDADGITRRVPLCEDRAAAQVMLTEIIRNVERQAAGLMDPSTPFLQEPIETAVKRYRRHLEAKRRSEAHISETERLIGKIADECRFRVLADLQSGNDNLESFLAKRLDSGVSHRTVNADLTAVRSFCRWLLEKKQLARDPTIGLELLNVDEDRRRERRALTDDEAQRLIRTTLASERTFRGLTGKDRAIIYMLAERAGLRRKELLSLRKDSFNFEFAPATVTVHAANSKRRELDVLPLSKDVGEIIAEYLQGRPMNEPLWTGSWWRQAAGMVRADLKDAGIELDDPSGLVLDFHAQRTTFITSLARAGVSPAVAQRLARHSDVNLTMRAYTRLQIEDLNQALDKLPSLTTTKDDNEETEQSLKTDDSETPLDDTLLRIAEAWPQLSDPIRRAIIALVDANSSIES